MNIKTLILSRAPGAFSREMLSKVDDMEKTLLEMCEEAGPLRQGLERVTLSGGKRLRPMLACCAWSMTGREREILPLMCMLETMHTASLIHDDVVDGAKMRRGVATINTEKGDDAAVRSGDYLLSKAMELLKVYRGTGINEALSRVSQEMCLGELDQRAGRFKPGETTREDYFLRIRRKTAYLMRESCRCGALAGGADEKTLECLADYGEMLGIAFQIRDDLGDIMDLDGGKTPLMDLRCGIATLPLIIAEELGGEDFIRLERDIACGRAPDDMLLRALSRLGAEEKTKSELRGICALTEKALDPLPESDGKKALRLLCRNISEV